MPLLCAVTDFEEGTSRPNIYGSDMRLGIRVLIRFDHEVNQDVALWLQGAACHAALITVFPRRDNIITRPQQPNIGLVISLESIAARSMAYLKYFHPGNPAEAMFSIIIWQLPWCTVTLESGFGPR